jgi:hypothetical protein
LSSAGNEALGNHEACSPRSDDQDVDLFSTRLANRPSFVGEAAQAGHVPSDLLDDVRGRRDTGEKMMVIDPLREKPIGGCQEIQFARAKDILRLDPLASSAWHQAADDVRLAVHADGAPIAASAQAIGSVGPVELGTAAEGDLAGRDESERDGLAFLGHDGVAVELELDRASRGR